MRKIKLFISLLFVLFISIGQMWGAESTIIYSETFGDNGSSNTAYSSASCYSATANMFANATASVASHYSGSGKVGKNNVNASSGYTGVSGNSAAWYQGGSGSGTTIVLQIDGINIKDYTNLSLSFGGYLTNGTTTSNKIEVYYKIDNGTETKITYSGLTSVATWSLCSGNIGATGNSLSLIFKQVRTGGYTVRIDDISLIGISSAGSGNTCDKSITLSKSEVALPAGCSFTISKDKGCGDGGGESVDVTATPASHYTFTGVTCKNSSSVEVGDIGAISSNKCTISGITEDVTIGAIFEEDPKHNAYFYVNGETISSEEYYEGEAIAFPTTKPDDIDGKKFQGWAEAEVASTTDTKPAMVSSKNMGNTDAKFYAVFATEIVGSDYTRISALNDLEAGGRYLIVGYENPTYKALPVDKASTLTTVTLSSSKISNPAEELIWTLEGTAKKWKIKSVSNGKYLQISGGNLSFEASTSLTFDASVSSSKFTFTSSATSGNKILSYYASGNKFNAYSNANTIYLYKAAIERSGYCTTFCTPLATPSNLAMTSATANSITFGWDAVANATGYEYKVGEGDWTTAVGRSATVNDLTAGQTVSVSVRATYSGSENYCATGAEASADLTTLYTITASVNNEDYGTVEVSLDNSAWSNSVAAAPGATIYVKATKTTGYSFNDWSVNDGGAGVFASTSEATTTFTSGAANTTIKATFVADVKVLAGISITTAPTKVDYLEGEFFDPAGLEVTASYEDGTSVVLESGYTYAPTTALTPGVEKVTISYTLDGKTETIEQAITVTPVHTVTWYVNGTAVKTVERVAKGTLFSALEKPTKPLDDDLSACDANKFMGWAKAIITKDEATESDVQFVADADAVSETMNAFYAVFATEDNTISDEASYTATFNKMTTGDNYSNYRSAHSYTSNSIDWSCVGNQSFTDNYIRMGGTSTTATNRTLTSGDMKSFGKTAKVTLTHAGSAIGKNTTLTINSIKLEVATANTFASGAIIDAVEIPSPDFSTAGTFDFIPNEGKEWTNGDQAIYYRFTVNYQVSGSNNSGINVKSLAFYADGTSYKDYITSCRTVTGLAVKTAPNKTAYCEGEIFDPAGLEVTLTYDEGDPVDVAYTEANASKFTFSPNTTDEELTTSNNKVTITYRGKSTTQTILVRRVEINAPIAVGGTYTVKVGTSAPIDAAGSALAAKKGQIITLASMAADGYKVSSTPFEVEDEDGEKVAVSKSGTNYTFTMPGKNVTITAKFAPTYTITAGACEHGSVSAIKDKDGNAITATSQNSKVVVEATEAEHYHLTGMYYVKADEDTHNEITATDGVYSFSMPAKNVTVYAEFEENDKFEINWYANGELIKSEVAYGESGSEAPSVADVEAAAGTYVLAGWAEAEYGNEAKTEPTLVSLTDGKYMPTVGKNLYAVYKRTVSSGTAKTYSFNYADSDIPTTYANDGGTITRNGVNFTHFDLARFSTGGILNEFFNIRKSTGQLYNEAEFPTKIKSVVVTYHSSSTNKCLELSIGNEDSWEAEPTTVAYQDIEPSIDGSVYTFDCSDYDFKWMLLSNGSNAVYVTDIVINCAPDEEYYYVSRFYTISNNLTACEAAAENAALVAKGSEITLTYTKTDACVWNEPEVKMGDATLVEDEAYTWNATTGEVYILEVLGNVSISIATVEPYVRTAAQFSAGTISTICLPKAVEEGEFIGCTVYEIAYKTLDANGDPYKIFFDEVLSMKAGVPYVIELEEGAEEARFMMSGNAVAEPDNSESKGLTGTFTAIDDLLNGNSVLKGNYMVYQDMIKQCGTGCLVGANKAYIVMSNVPTEGAAPAPGRRRISLGNPAAVPGVATGVENVDNATEQVEKHLINGVIYVTRGGRMYDLNGRMVK